MKNVLKSLYYVPEITLSVYFTICFLLMTKIAYLFVPLSVTTFLLPNYFWLYLLFLILVTFVIKFTKWAYSELYPYYH